MLKGSKISRHMLRSCRTTHPMAASPSAPCEVVSRSFYCQPTRIVPLPLKAGTPIKGMDFFSKDKEPIMALERSEYPEWVDRLASAPPSLAQLRRMNVEDADDYLKKRYLKLRRRMVIKANNQSMEK